MGELLLPEHMAEDLQRAHVAVFPPPQPSHERYELLTNELQRASTQLETFVLLAELETIVPDGFGQNLLAFYYPRQKNQQIPRGFKLQQKIEGMRAVVAALTERLDAWNAQEEAYHAAHPSPSESVKPTVEEF